MISCFQAVREYQSQCRLTSQPTGFRFRNLALVLGSSTLLSGGKSPIICQSIFGLNLPSPRCTTRVHFDRKSFGFRKLGHTARAAIKVFRGAESSSGRVLCLTCDGRLGFSRHVPHNLLRPFFILPPRPPTVGDPRSDDSTIRKTLWIGPVQQTQSN